MTEQYTKTTLPNGARIVSERVPHVRSASIAVWIETGSRHEPAHLNGAAHFIEHMLFKGTNARSAEDIAQMVDESGGQLNAYTAKETTCYHARVLDERLTQIVDALSDMIMDSKFDEKDVESERGVILEEIDMYDDSPDDLAHERLLTGAFKGASISKPILGTPGTLSKITGASLKRYMSRRYVGDVVVVSLSGSFSDSDLANIEAKFGAIPAGSVDPPAPAAYTPCILTRKKPVEQNQICIGYPGCSSSDSRRFTYQLLNNILGGGVSSRLFMKLREELGLCYSIYSATASYADCGIFYIGFGLSKKTEREAIKVILDEIRKLANDGITTDELKRSLDLVKSNLLLSLESTAARSSRLGRSEILYGYQKTIEETINDYSSVTVTDIQELARDIFQSKNASLSAVGNVLSKKEYTSLITETM